MDGNIPHQISPTSPFSEKYPIKQKNYILSVLFVVGFLVIIGSLKYVDIYHNYFFKPGLMIFAYNFLRSIFALYVIWIIYVSGYSILRLFKSYKILNNLSYLERIIIGFSIGLGFWHLLMLGLGELNLYYPWVMVSICSIILLTTLSHCEDCIDEVLYKSKPLFPKLIYMVIGVSLIWLLCVRGLYPGGGGDYYTHYFYYYMSVIKNHGLAPNDVWYHYYYSKGAGLAFLGILLSDPEAPAIMTFCCVAIATLSLATLTIRTTPKTLWPAICALLYVMYNLVSLSGAGEFQKTHEETTAIVILATWVLCMYEIRAKEWEKPFFIALGFLMIGASILTQAVSIFFGVFFGCRVIVAFLQKNWRQMWFFMWLGIITICAVFGTLLLNYTETGLITDQALDFAWQFANLERLDQWGVIPNIIMVAWIRDNYSALVVPWGPQTISQLVNFMRLDAIWILLISSIIGCLYLLRDTPRTKFIKNSTANVLYSIGGVIIVFSLLSMFAGRSQATSYYRFCSFFMPLITLFCAIAWGLVIPKYRFVNIIIPLGIFMAVLVSWNTWFTHAYSVTKNTGRYILGIYSIAQAYAHQDSGLPFGGIHPGAFSAMHHVPPGNRVWSTNVDSYCMAPDCQIESIISFKLSSHLNEILNASPMESKNILQNENLNYFLFSADSLLLDLLPYSQLFNPGNIAKYLAIKWTDGNTYLLTWIGPNTSPLDAQFMALYERQIKYSQHPWFRFDKAVPEMNASMQKIRNSSHPWYPINFSWRKNVEGINILNATYGKNCIFWKTPPFFYQVTSDNVKNKVMELCHGKTECRFEVNVEQFGDPACGCLKDFQVVYQCSSKNNALTLKQPGEALGKMIDIQC